VRSLTADAVGAVADLVGVHPHDRRITFGVSRFPVPAWYPDEDRVAFPLSGGLAVVGLLLALARPGRIAPERPGPLRAYAVAVTALVLLHAATIKWQPWGNRLLLYALIVAVPPAGLWLDALFRHRSGKVGRISSVRRSVAVLAAVAVLGTSALAGVLAVSYGFPRRLVGDGSLLTTSEWETRFLRRPAWAEEYQWAADAVRASGARRVGLLEGYDDWEYPWWLLLREEPGAERREIVALRSVLPNRPPADPASVDAIVCTGDRSECADTVPAGWRFEFRSYVGYAVPLTPL
jgi:hypothetical protein